MKVILDGQEIELIDKLEPGVKELDKLTPIENNDIENEDTIELTEDMIKKIQAEGEKNE